jgi:hypothetical protein
LAAAQRSYDPLSLVDLVPAENRFSPAVNGAGVPRRSFGTAAQIVLIAILRSVNLNTCFASGDFCRGPIRFPASRDEPLASCRRQQRAGRDDQFCVGASVRVHPPFPPQQIGRNLWKLEILQD